MPLAAAEFGSGKIQVVAQDAEQRAFAIGMDAPPGSVDIDFRHSDHIPIVAPNLLIANGAILPGQMKELNALKALFPDSRRLILSAMFGEPDRWWSRAELAGCAGVQPHRLQSHLARLLRGGIVRVQTLDGAVRLQPDPDCPIFAELHGMVAKLMPSLVGKTILVVEDTKATAQITRILLESWGYAVLEAHDSQEALDVSDSHPDEIHLLLSDVNMPGMSGPQLADELMRRRPKLRVVLMSGYPADQLSGTGNAFLPKPFNPASLSQTIRKTLDG